MTIPWSDRCLRLVGAIRSLGPKLGRRRLGSLGRLLGSLGGNPNLLGRRTVGVVRGSNEVVVGRHLRRTVGVVRRGVVVVDRRRGRREPLGGAGSRCHRLRRSIRINAE